MFNLKKLFKICTALLAISMITVVLSACSCGGSEESVIENQFGTYYKNIDTVITYKLDGQNVNTKVEEEKSLVLQGVFNKCDELPEVPECKFSDDFKVTYQEKDYLVAQDGCNYIKFDGKYYRIPVSDRMILNDVFEHYDVVIKDQEIDEAHDLYKDATKDTKKDKKED